MFLSILIKTIMINFSEEKKQMINPHAPQGGVYTCRADNGFGPRPVTASVRVESTVSTRTTDCYRL